MNEAEELQAILSEPGKAVGKYFDDVDGDIFYCATDLRACPMDVDARQPLVGAYRGDNFWRVDAASPDIHTELLRVRKADPYRNLNLNVGDTVELVNGDVVTLMGSLDPMCLSSGKATYFKRSGEWAAEDVQDPYHPLHILKVITRAAKGGVMDSDVIKKLREDVDAISARVHELEGLV